MVMPMMPPGPPPMGMAPPMLAPPMLPMPPDPLEALLADPEFVKHLLGKTEKRKPVYPAWYKPPKKPTQAQMLDKIARDREAYGPLLDRFAADTARIRMEKVGVFKDYDAESEITFTSSALADEDQLVAALVGSIDPNWEAPYRHAYDRDEAQQKEDFLRCLHEEARRQHAVAGYGARLEMDVVKFITRYGRVVTRNVIDLAPDPGRPPFAMTLIDPATCFPTFEGRRGLRTLTRAYVQTVADFVGDHDDAERTVERKVINGLDRDGETSTGKDRYEWGDYVEVLEYWDRKWVAYFLAGRLVKGPVAHDYGEPPFVYTLAPFGDPACAANPDQRRFQTRDGSIITAGQNDLANKGLSYYHTRFIPHEQREAMLGKLATQLKKWGREAMDVYQDDFAMQKGMPEISDAEGARNQLWLNHEEARPRPMPQLPAALGPLMAQANEDNARGSMPPAAYGLTSGSQQAGFAIESLSESGRDKIAPVLATAELHYQLCGEQRLRFWRNFGDLLGEKEHKGVYYVPRSLPEPGKPAAYEVTPAIVDRTGWAVQVSLTGVRLSSLGPLANALSIVRREGAITRRDFIKMLGLDGSRNPERTMREIDVETLRDMPEYKLAALLRYVVEEEQDPKLADFIAMQIQQKQMAGQQPGQPPGPQQPPQPGMPPPGGPVQVQGTSLPGMNMPPGQMGGRPPMPGQPPGAIGFEP